MGKRRRDSRGPPKPGKTPTKSSPPSATILSSSRSRGRRAAPQSSDSAAPLPAVLVDDARATPDGTAGHPSIPIAAAIPDAAVLPSLIVGIGGSAGSLTPLREFFVAQPPDSGMAFVVVSHQAPTGRSLLPEILAKVTAMPVEEIRGETRALANHVYVAPRGHVVDVHDSILSIAGIGTSPRTHFPIDSFFGALARDRGAATAALILSGTGTDGTLGLGELRAESGLSLVQSPETAEFDGMPASAITARNADFVLPIAEMPAKLAEYARSVTTSGRDGMRPRISTGDMARILGLIRARGGHDFSSYRHDTLMRRIERRMGLLHIEHGSEYARHLETDQSEIDALWHDWLIGVTEFFRDPEAYLALARSGLPALIAARSGNEPLRIWVPACASGEEAYSIAIEVIEALEARGGSREFQLFATDLDPSAIETARIGRYPKSIASAVGARRLERFFAEDEHGYRVQKELREHIVFAVQDVLHDPPFTRMDLISSRNLLIYVVPAAQEEIIGIFRYSLNPGGLLLLGASEHLGKSADFFTTLDKRWRLFRRCDAFAAKLPVRLSPRTAQPPASAAAPSRSSMSDLDLAETLRSSLAERFGPPSVVVDLQGQIRQAHGRVGPYLELPPGRANLNVLDMARDGLRTPLASALRAIAKEGAGPVEQDVRSKTDDGWREVRLTLARIEPRRHGASPLILVSFEPLSAQTTGRRNLKPVVKARPTGRAKLEQELEQMRQDLQVSISNLQAANEELASANEETQSANEELQSTNEELQTAKEETQSLNEELQTVNAELIEKLRGLEQANDDLLNLMSNIEVATIFLDERLRVKRFTPQARSVARLIDGDVGRPLADLATVLDYPDLLADAGSVLSSLRPIEKQASAPGGVWYTVRIRPYRTNRNAIDGIVVTFIDITQAKRAERVQAARSLAEGIVDAVHEPILVLDPTLRVVRANRSFYKAFRVEPAETEWNRIDELGSRQWNSPPLHELIEATLRDGSAFEGAEVVHEFPHIGRRRMLLSGRPVSIEGDEKPALIVIGIQDAGPSSATSASRKSEEAVS